MTEVANPPTPEASEPDDPTGPSNIFTRSWARIDTTNAVVLPGLAILSALIIGAFVIALSAIDEIQDGAWVGILDASGDADWALIAGAVQGLYRFESYTEKPSEGDVEALTVRVAEKDVARARRAATAASPGRTASCSGATATRR